MRTTMYTALYHSLIAPSVSSDADGRWRGPDNAVHKADFTMHSTFSLWDTFRAEHPLLTLVQPEATNADFVKSLVASQQVSPFGILPVWQFQGRSEEHTSELQSLMRTSYAVFCLKKKK